MNADIANNKHQQQAGNEIGAEGARALSEALKTNTTLQSLNLGCEQEESEEDGWIADIANNQHQQAGNEIGDEGARALSDALKTNTTLHELNLGGEQEESVEVWWICRDCQHKHQQADNNIGAEGAGALSEALKASTSLVSLVIWKHHSEQGQKHTHFLQIHHHLLLW